MSSPSSSASVQKRNRIDSGVRSKIAALTSSGGASGIGAARRLAQVPHDPLDQVDERLRARVDDAGLRERLHLLRRVLERPLRLPSDSGSSSAKSADLAGARRDVARPVADDRQDRPLDGPRDRRVRRVRRAHDRGAEVRRSRRAARRADPPENPQKNCARIAPELPRAPPTASSASARDISRTWRWRTRAMPAAIFWSVDATLVPVSPSGTGKDVDLVERLGAVRDEARSRDDRAREAAAVQVADRDHGLMGAGDPSGDAAGAARAVRYSSATAGSRSR